MSLMTSETVTSDTPPSDSPLTVAEWREMQLMIRECHDFIMTLQHIGLQVAEGTTPMAIMMRTLIPNLLNAG
jgi:hypothetical protein